MSSQTPARRGRTFGSGLGRAAMACAALLAFAGCGASTHTDTSKANSTYGALPSYLPKSTVRPDGVLDGSARRPAMTSEGDGVEVRLSHGSVLATVVGPQVPGEGLPYQVTATTCTWTVTLTHVTGRIPVTVRDFSTIDHLGGVYHPKLVAGRPRPPAVLTAGRTATFQLRAVMRTGQGLMRWAPGGRRIVADWDFEVEVD